VSIAIGSAIQKTGDSFGCIINLPFISEAIVLERIHDLLFRLAGMKKPLAILDSSGEFELPDQLKTKGHIRIFRPAGVSSGRNVAQYLHQLGHSHTAYISHVHGQKWSIQRLDGMQRFIQEAGIPGCIIPIVVENIEPIYNHSFWAGSLKVKEAEMIKGIRESNSDVSLIQTYLKSISWTRYFGSMQQDKIKDDLEVLEFLSKNKLGDKLFASLRDSILAQVTEKKNQVLYDQIFLRALDEHKCTAWVLANDGLAMHALRFLDRKKVKVPDAISICGFDNVHSTGVLDLQLTSFDFNQQGLAYKMFWFIQRFDDRKSKKLPEVEEVDGMIIERGTTGKVKS
jgi:hypothetical protein